MITTIVCITGGDQCCEEVVRCNQTSAFQILTLQLFGLDVHTSGRARIKCFSKAIHNKGKVHLSADRAPPIALCKARFCKYTQ